MEYRMMGNTGVRVSALGFGTMRLPVLEDGTIHEEEAIQMIRHAIDEGVNYVDTAYPYHQGMSEVVVGKALKDGYREKTYLASKCPVWEIKCPEDFDRILDEQLSKLQVETIDFYLLHAIGKERFENVVQKFDLIKKMEQAKAEGKIRYIGFSFHDNAEAFLSIMDSYDSWDFCQIQMNYIDIHNQATIEGMEYAASKGLAVIVMEPLLGGKLANPPQNVLEVLNKEKTPVEWALDFLWDRKEVSLLLSGMSTMKQTTDNIEYANRSKIGMLTDDQKEMYVNAKRIYDTMALVSCTKCAYCMPCPFGLDIPKTFEAYNATVSKGMNAAKEVYEEIEIKADSCRSCKKCEQVCPQAIPISDVMKKVATCFEGE